MTNQLTDEALLALVRESGKREAQLNRLFDRIRELERRLERLEGGPEKD